MTTKTIFITGANGGLGSVLIPMLLQKSWKVYAGVHGDTKNLPSNQNLIMLPCDVTDTQSIVAAVQHIAAKESGLQAVVNMVGIPIQGPVEVVPESSMRQAFDINFFGPFVVMQQFLPLLRAGKGRIVNVSGILAKAAVPFTGPIASSKGALSLLSDAARMELSQWHIPVVIIEPSGMRTPAMQKSQDSLERSLTGASDVQRTWYAPLVARAAAAKFGADSPNIAAGMIVEALEAPRPKPYYYPGHGARMIKAVAHLSAPLRDKLIMHSMKLDK